MVANDRIDEQRRDGSSFGTKGDYAEGWFECLGAPLSFKDYVMDSLHSSPGGRGYNLLLISVGEFGLVIIL